MTRPGTPPPVDYDAFTAPFVHVSEDEARAVVRDRYGLHPTKLVRLTTERDDTFRVWSATGQVLLKVAHPADDPVRIEAQSCVLAHLDGAAGPIAVPRMRRPLDSESVHVETPDGARIVRVLDFIEGPLLHGHPMTPAGMRRLGSAHAHLSRRMAEISPLVEARFADAVFDHPWSIAEPGDLGAFVDAVTDSATRKLVRTALDTVLAATTPGLGRLEPAIMHNDFQGRNVILDPNDAGQVLGVIDFGDLARLPRVADLAVASSYADRYAADGTPAERGAWANVLDFVRGHTEVQPLTAAEQALLPPLVLARVVQRIAVASLLAATSPERAAIQRPGIEESTRLLERLLPTTHAAADNLAEGGTR